MTTEEKMESSCITNTDYIRPVLMPYYEGSVLKAYDIRLNTIIEYAAEVLKKPNVFIYDRSCGVIHKMINYNVMTHPITGKEYRVPIYPPVKDVIPLVNRFSEEGFGKHKKRLHRKTNRRNRNRNRNRNRRKTKRTKR
jgi:hypothetical protein